MRCLPRLVAPGQSFKQLLAQEHGHLTGAVLYMLFWQMAGTSVSTFRNKYEFCRTDSNQPPRIPKDNEMVAAVSGPWAKLHTAFSPGAWPPNRGDIISRFLADDGEKCQHMACEGEVRGVRGGCERCLRGGCAHAHTLFADRLTTVRIQRLESCTMECAIGITFFTRGPLAHTRRQMRSGTWHTPSLPYLPCFACRQRSPTPPEIAGSEISAVPGSNLSS